MDLRTQLEKDFLEAYKAKREQEISVLRMAKSALKNFEIAQGHTLSEDEVVKVLKKEKKLREESASEYEKNGRIDLASKEKAEAAMLEKYIPKPLSEEEVAKTVEETIKETGASGMKDMGKVMGAVMKKLGGNADGSIVSKCVKELLG